MGSRIKSFFFARSNNNNNNSSSANLQDAKPYDSIAASDPPVTGSYPVAGNGPNVLLLEEIQRNRPKRRQSTSSSIIAAPSPNIPRRREDLLIQRPRTAPHNGTPGGGHAKSKSEKATNGRTLSGFSMKSPPSIFNSNSSRRGSLKSSIDRPSLPSNPNPNSTPPSIPRVSSPPPRKIRSYIPTIGSATPDSNQNAPAVSPYAQQQHHRNSAQALHKSYVDLLDAHSNIQRTREALLHRYKASGVRNYGEDVADRNIDAFGERSDRRDSKLDLNSPEFSYLRSVYGPPGPSTNAGSALGHVLGTDGGDDIHQQPLRGPQLTSSSLTTTTTTTTSSSFTRSGSRPTPIYPPRVDSTAAASLSYGAGPSRDDRQSTNSNGAMSSQRRATVRDNRTTQSVHSASALSIPPVPERGPLRPVTFTTTTTTTSTTSPTESNPPLVAPSAKTALTPPSRPTSRAGEAASSKTKRRSMSATSQSTIGPPTTTNGGTSPRKSSVSFAAFHGSQEQPQSSSHPPATSAPNRNGMIMEGGNQPHSLEGIVDLTNTVDTDVTTKQLPAIVHEHVTPTRHEIRQEVITREIHTHDIFHRVLPVIETEILPTKHYVKGPDGKTLIEIPESAVPYYKLNGRLDQNWHISKPGPSSLLNGTDLCETASRASTDSAPDGPVVALSRGEPRARPRGNSKASSLKSSKREPVLSSKKEYMTKEGIPRTEYVWRHPPVFETATGETQPVYVGAGIGDLSGVNCYSDEDDELGAEFGAARSSAKGEEEPLFRDSGYGSRGMLPGLKDINPSSTTNGGAHLGQVVCEDTIGQVKAPSNAGGEATKASGRMRERRRSSATSKTNGTDALENGFGKMSIK